MTVSMLDLPNLKKGTNLALYFDNWKEFTRIEVIYKTICKVIKAVAKLMPWGGGEKSNFADDVGMASKKWL